MFLWDEPRTRKRIGKTEKELLFKAQGGRCNYCGKKLGISYFHIDHKTPFSRNGSDRVSNLQLLCGPCNTRKGDMTDGEFRKRFNLVPARQSKNPPSKAIPQKHFEEISKDLQAKRAKQRRRDKENDFWW